MTAWYERPVLPDEPNAASALPLTLQFQRVRSVVTQWDDSHVSATEWANGEGFDVDVDDKQRVGLTWEEWRALKKAVKALLKGEGFGE